MPNQYTRRPQTPWQRFSAKFVVSDNGCWLWQQGLNSSGYGAFWTGSGYKTAHCWSYEYFVALIPPGLVIDHLCRTRNCVNWEHLEPVMPQENVRRGHGHGSETHCPRGHEYTEGNTRVYRDRRHCRECDKEKHQEKRDAIKAAKLTA